MLRNASHADMAGERWLTYAFHLLHELFQYLPWNGYSDSAGKKKGSLNVLTVSTEVYHYTLHQRFPNFLPYRNPYNNLYIPRKPYLWQCLQGRKQRHSWLRIVNCWTKLLLIFRRTFEFFSHYFKMSVHLFHDFSRNPSDILQNSSVPQNTGWEPLPQIKRRN